MRRCGLFLLACLASGVPGLVAAQAMGGLQHARAPTAASLPAPAPAPAATAPAIRLPTRDLNAAAPQNVRPPCNCPAPQHPTLPARAVVMFQASSPPPMLPPPPQASMPAAPQPPVRIEPIVPGQGWQGQAPRYSIAGLAAADASREAAPRAVSGPPPEAARETRGPFRRIYEDTRRLVVRDAPEALADALPWVDRPRKDEPFEQVLDRVSDELTRAAAADPEWALDAEREVRALAGRLERLPAPPPLPESGGPVLDRPGAGDNGARPFRPRPIWPGATAREEAQRRPVTLTTDGLEETGPMASGTSQAWQPPPDLAPPPETARPQRRSSRRTAR